jgi:tetratricopeptide (TPR) repeat protein
MDPEMVEAIRQIKYDGKNPFQLGETAKNHGNTLFSYGKKNPGNYNKAITAYNVSEARDGVYSRETLILLVVLTLQEAEGWLSQVDTDEARVMLSQVYSNRAFAHLMLRNHRSCKDDCDRALRLKPDNVKALYRMAKVRSLHPADQVAKPGLNEDATRQ